MRGDSRLVPIGMFMCSIVYRPDGSLVSGVFYLDELGPLLARRRALELTLEG